MGYVIAALAIGCMIAIHEFGHFIVAKLSGMVVTEYSLGMGPQLWAKQIGETKYALRLLPIGGFVSVWGEDALESQGKGNGQGYPSERNYVNIAKWKKALFIIAGPTMNLLTAVVIALVASGITEGYIQSVYVPEVNTQAIYWGDSKLRVENVDPEVLDARLKSGDQIKTVNGYPILVMQDLAYFMLTKDGYVDLGIVRDGQRECVPEVSLKNLYADLSFQANTGIHKIASAVRLTVSNVVMSFAGLKMLITGDIPVTMVSGPVGAVAVMGQTVEQGAGTSYLDALILFAAVSANLGIMNLLPLPALDGGHLLFLGIEAVIRRPIPEKVKAVAQMAMFALLMLLMLAVTGMDIHGLLTGKFNLGG